MTSVGTAADAERLGAGWSDATDPAGAAREAVELALHGRTPTSADVVVLFADAALDALQLVDAAMEAASPARVVAGGASATFSTSAGLAACVALHLPAGQQRFGIGWADTEHGDAEEATRRAVVAARDEAAHHGQHGTLLLLSDIRIGDQRHVVRGAYDIAGATVPIVGGAVGCEPQPQRCWVSADGMILAYGVVAIWIASRQPLAVTIDHGWQPVSRPMQVTRATEHRILELDGRPAEEAYLEARRSVDPAMMQLAQPWMQLPVGVPGDDGRYAIRAFVRRLDDGTFVLEGSVHEQAIVRLMGASPQDLFDGAAVAGRSALDQLATPPRGAIVFACNARRDLLGDEVVREIDAIGGALGELPAIGFFSYGEFAKLPGSSGFHAASVAVLAL